MNKVIPCWEPAAVSLSGLRAGLFWRQSRDQADANLGRPVRAEAALTLRMPSCMKVSPPGSTLWSSSSPLRMRSLRSQGGNERRNTVVNGSGAKNVYFVTFICEPSFQPEPDARRRGSRIIVSTSAALEQRKKNCNVANEYSKARVVKEAVTQ